MYIQKLNYQLLAKLKGSITVTIFVARTASAENTNPFELRRLCTFLLLLHLFHLISSNPFFFSPSLSEIFKPKEKWMTLCSYSYVYLQRTKRYSFIKEIHNATWTQTLFVKFADRVLLYLPIIILIFLSTYSFSLVIHLRTFLACFTLLVRQ